MLSRGSILSLVAGCILALAGTAIAQAPDMVDPIPPPIPPKPVPKDVPEYESLVDPDDEEPWGLSEDLVAPLKETARIYRVYARRFTCYETARTAEYGKDRTIKNERKRRYGYLLVKATAGDTVREYRQELAKDGSVKPHEVTDEEPFPPAYAWVFMFSRFNQPHFSWRFVEERFDGFDWVYEIEFKGDLRFTDGKDIRQWEGRILVDAVTYTPLEIRAEPVGQTERIDALYRNWSKSFNLLGFRSAPRPLGHRAHLEFRFRAKEQKLRFPTELRYDTFRAVSPKQVVPVESSTRTYSGYQIQFVNTQQEVGDQVDEP